jgi:hypothetical protein
METEKKRKFKVTYRKYGVSQEMNLVGQSEFEQIYKPMVMRMRELSEEINSVNKKKDADLIREKLEEIGQLKILVNGVYGSFFTSGSPLGLAMETGVMGLPASQGGSSEVIFEEIH